MHILFTSDFLDPVDIGGSGRVILETGTRLVEQGHRVGILTGCYEFECHQREFSGAPIEWCTFPYPLGKGGILSFLRARRGVREALRRYPQRPDVVIHNQPLTADALGKLDVPSIYLFHSPWPLEYLAARYDETELARASAHGPAAMLQVGFRRKVEYQAVGRAQQIVTLSRTMSELAQNIHGVPESRITVLPGSADLQRFTPADPATRRRLRSRWQVSAQSPLWVSVRRLIPRTGVDLLIESVRQALPHHPDLQLLIAGNGPQRAELERLVQGLGLAHVIRFVGYVDDEELPDLYRAADLAVMPTRALEGFGLSTLEALACGTPVVATPVGGSVEILEALQPDLLASSVSAEALTATLQTWTERRTESEDLRAACRRHAEGYSWEHMSVGLERIAQQLASEPLPKLAVPV